MLCEQRTRTNAAHLSGAAGYILHEPVSSLLVILAVSCFPLHDGPYSLAMAEAMTEALVNIVLFSWEARWLRTSTLR